MAKKKTYNESKYLNAEFDIIEPAPMTLRTYGLNRTEWRALLAMSKGICPICSKKPKTKRLVIDHEHVKGWKELPDKERKKFVRGLVCGRCNSRYLRTGFNAFKAKNALVFLELYEAKRLSEGVEFSLEENLKSVKL